MLRFFFILLLAIVIAAGVFVYNYRYEIFQVSAESIIRRNLPDYVSVGSLVFDLKNGVLEVENLGIKNPRGFTERFLASVDAISCRYRMKGQNILDGIEVTEITADHPHINIERSRSGELNASAMGEVMNAGKRPGPAPGPSGEKKEPFYKKFSFGKKINIADVIKLPETINIKNGEVTFRDDHIMRVPYKLTFEDVNATLDMKLNDDYSRVLSAGSRGSGFVSGDRRQRVDWDVTLDPTTARLTMAGTYKVSDVEIRQFAPYYDPYSPIIVEDGNFSGDLIFNFDNGNIGSTNIVYLKNFRFREKSDWPGGQYWQASLSEVVQYLRTATGEIVFDFKIKGDMNSPTFYLGPYVKQAIQRLVIDKISDVISELQQPQGQAQGGQPVQRPKSDAEKVMDVIQLFMKE